MAGILVIDDDPALLRVMRIALTARGHDVMLATNGAQGISEAALHDPDLVVLDLGLPDVDGVEVCRRIREWSAVPVIVLSADGDEHRKVAALDAGADDYMTKPFGMDELQARLRVALRRRPQESATEALLVVGPLELDIAHHGTRMNGEAVELTKREFGLLAFLARHAGKVCTQRMILDAVWGHRYAGQSQYLREYAYRLRRKLGDEEGTLLVTHPGIGYQLVPPDTEAAVPAPESEHPDG